jgi:rhamnulokinase
MQMLAVGEIETLAEGRDIVRRSFSVETFQPQDAEAWTEAYRSFLKLLT